MPSKEAPVKLEFALLQLQVALVGSHLEHRELLATEGDHFQLFFLLGYKGWLHLEHFNEQPLFTCIESGAFCAELQPNEKGKKLLWRGRTRRAQQDRSVPGGFKQQRAPACGQSPSTPPSSLAGCGFPDMKC